MPHWFESTLLALDLETTGLDPLEDRIVQAAVVLMDADESVSDTSWDGIVDPGVPIPAEASDIHGITTDRARREGIPPVEALRRIARLFHDADTGGIPLVIYNAPFDWPFVLAESQRHGVSLATPEIIDPLVIDRAVDRYRRGSRRLEAVAKHYDHNLGQTHDARADAIAAGAIARAVGGTVSRRRRSHATGATTAAGQVACGARRKPFPPSGEADRPRVAAAKHRRTPRVTAPDHLLEHYTVRPSARQSHSKSSY